MRSRLTRFAYSRGVRGGRTSFGRGILRDVALSLCLESGIGGHPTFLKRDGMRGSMTSRFCGGRTRRRGCLGSCRKCSDHRLQGVARLRQLGKGLRLFSCEREGGLGRSTTVCVVRS